MSEKEIKLRVLDLIAKEIEERRKKSGFIVDRIDTEALIKVYNEILKINTHRRVMDERPHLQNSSKG